MIGFSIMTRDLVKKRGRCRALDGFSVSVPRGSIMGLVGENGAGKTTWMMTVAGFLNADAGEIDILGMGPFDASVHAGRVAILPQDSELPLELTLMGALYRFGRIQGLSDKAAGKSAREALSAVNLSDRANASVRTLSHGMRKRAMVAQCFIGNPDIVLLDEPLNGLDPTESARLRRFIKSQQGLRTVIVSSHNLEDVERLCTHVAIAHKGRMVKMDTMSAYTRSSERVAYKLTSAPLDFAALQSAVPGMELEWRADEKLLICVFSDAAGGIAEVNRKFLPLLLSQSGVISVMPGQSLEEALEL
ncbi:MAG: ABC transporter ATP-binding protein [Kiritimatiellae bacterium]|nr:ABC transporter ATP-binding protein [Kiritimatiellia bacterium]